MQVSRSAYYAWLQRPQTATEKEDVGLAPIIHSPFRKSRATYGARRIKKALFDQRRTVSRRRTSRLMDQENLACKTQRKFKAATGSKHDKPISPNLLDRGFNVGQPDQVYVGDITYIHTQEGRLCLAVVIDLCSRQVAGWSMAEHMRAQLVNDALSMAIWKRKPDKGLLWHTDRGSQYASESHRALLRQHSISRSMGRKGNCRDNAVSESFFHTLKTELTHHETYQTRSTAKQAVFEYIGVFLQQGAAAFSQWCVSPVDYELQQMAA